MRLRKSFDCLCVCFVHRGEPEVHTHAGGHAASGGGARPADVSAPGSAGEGATAPLSGEHVKSHHQPEKTSIAMDVFYSIYLLESAKKKTPPDLFADVGFPSVSSCKMLKCECLRTCVYLVYSGVPRHRAAI